VSDNESGRKPTFLLAGAFLKDAMRQDVVSKIEEIAERVAASEGLEVVEVELKGTGGNRLLRIFIDKPEGVSHADCETISQQVGTILDVEDVVPGHYTLEVSSPGVERKLLKPNDYIRFQGKKAKIVLREPVEKQRHWEGTLAGFENEAISLAVNADRVLRFPLNQVERANLKFEW
jgi:ribosome maturation factor RimP